MSVNWKTAIKPAAQSLEFQSAAVQMKPAERIANAMDIALAAFKSNESCGSACKKDPVSGVIGV